MSVAAGTTSDLARAAGPGLAMLAHRRRVSVAEYHRMTEAGVFGPEPRIELVEGMILEKMTKHPPHNLACDLVQYLLIRSLPAGYFVSMSTPLTIEDRDGEPEPDAMVLRGQPRDYAGRRRLPADAAIVVEVSDSSYDVDRTSKWMTYAAARVPVYWLVDVNRGRLEMHTEPAGEDEGAHYGLCEILEADAEPPLILDGREVARFAVREILP